MPVISTIQIGSYEKGGGKHYCQFETTFDNADPIRSKKLHDSADGSGIVSEVETEAIERRKKYDALKAVTEGLHADHGEATLTDIRREYVKRSFLVYQKRDYPKAYVMMSKYMPQLIALGLTGPQYATLLDTTVAKVQQLNQIWNFLNNNSAVWSAAP